MNQKVLQAAIEAAKEELDRDYDMFGTRPEDVRKAAEEILRRRPSKAGFLRHIATHAVWDRTVFEVRYGHVCAVRMASTGFLVDVCKYFASLKKKKAQMSCSTSLIFDYIDDADAARKNAITSFGYLYGAQMKNCEMSGLAIRRARASGADVRHSKFEKCDLKMADFSNAKATWANFRGADLRDAQFISADLTFADFTGADLRGANFRYANLFGTDFSRAKVDGVDFDNSRMKGVRGLTYPLAFPCTGRFTGYTTGWGPDHMAVLITLEIPEDAQVSSATTACCRCDRALVTDLETFSGERLDSAWAEASFICRHLVFERGKVIESVNGFDPNRWHDGVTGIHFYMDKENALKSIYQ